MEPLRAVVREAWAATPRVRALRLTAPGGAPLPDWTAGAHVDVAIPGVGLRSYSLIETEPRDGPPLSYQLGVLRETASRGGSAYMHELRVGDPVEITPPVNQFPLAETPGEIALLAGGIGVTPLIAMARDLRVAGRPFSFIYAGRSRAEMAFLEEVARLAEGRLAVHADDEAGGVFDLARFLRGAQAAHVYLCGPTPMIEAAIALSRELDWPQGRLRFEVFASPTQKSGDGSFEVELKSSGRIYQVPPGKTILDVLIEAGEDPLHDCKRGDCGICQVGVLAGEVDHRDFILTDSEKASNAVMQICVSRAKSKRLTLDL